MPRDKALVVVMFFFVSDFLHLNENDIFDMIRLSEILSLAVTQALPQVVSVTSVLLSIQD